MKRIFRWLTVALALCLFCTGCSLDVESFLRPPRSRGEQQQVQLALETYIRDRGDGDRYILKYPTKGEHTAAFVLCDDRGRPVEGAGEAQMAVAFYALTAAPDVTHINLLQRDGSGWVSVADRSGPETDLQQVSFGDLDGNGFAELLTGWSTYNSREHRLAVYHIEQDVTLLTDERLYTDLYVGDLTASGTDSLLLFRVASGGHVTASLERLEGGSLRTVDTVSLDGQIEQFGGMILCRLAQAVHGLYVEGVRKDNTLVTELIYWDSTGLCAPFYDKKTNSTLTRRANGLPAMDIDGDGQVEIPGSRLLSDGAANPGLTDYITSWRVWDYATRSWSDRLQTVVNAADGYLVILDEAQQSHLSTAYDPDTHTLDLMDETTGRIWLRLYCGDGESLPDGGAVAGLETVSLLTDDRGVATCMAWFDPAVLEEEKVHYTVCRLAEGG